MTADAVVPGPVGEAAVPRILLVDDRADNLLALEAVLEPLGLDLATADSGEEALRRLLNEDFSLIVLDVQMPGLDGFETARLIKLREKTRHIPIIFLTAISGAQEHHLEGYASGAIDYVYKPFEPAILRAKVAAVLEFVGVKERLEREVAERTASERRLAESEERYRTLVEHAPEAIVVLDLDTGRFVDANAEAERLFGRGRQELYGLGPSDVSPPPVEPVAGQESQSAAVVWLERMARGNAEAFEWIFCHAAGSSVLCEVRLLPLPASDRRLARGSLIDITQRRQVERAAAELLERDRALRQAQQIAQTLQRSLLPDRLPEVQGMRFAARYLPGSAGLEVGGDWYDVLPLPSGDVVLAIGDVVGRGLRAAATMGQLRTALRAYALVDPAPGQVVERLGVLAGGLPEAEMATLSYVLLQPAAGLLTYMCAGHPPPMLVQADGEVTFLDEGRVTPLGVPSASAFEGVMGLERDCLLVLYTDGLIERPGSGIDEGLAALSAAARSVPGASAEALGEAIMAALLGDAGPRDDVALLIASCTCQMSDHFHLSVAADPRWLSALRHAMARWLVHVGADAYEQQDLILAVSEATTNAMVHAYGARPGMVEVEAQAERGAVEITVRDHGNWRPQGATEGGRGLILMQALVDSCEVETGRQGTEVRMRRRLGQPLRPALAGGVRFV